MSRKITPRPLAELFWAHVLCNLTSRCWEWQGSRHLDGYGRLSVYGRAVPQNAHRVAWELTYGPVPPRLFVLHRCDNPPCVNPSHLFLGTAKDNTADMVAKGRAPRQRAKLTDAQVLDARARYSFRKVTTVMLAREYGSSKEAVRRAIKGERYRHV